MKKTPMKRRISCDVCGQGFVDLGRHMKKAHRNIVRWGEDGGPTGLDGRSNYGGQDMSDYYVGLQKNRDSEVIDRVNFDVALERLGGEQSVGAVELVKVGHFGHWACGWYEQILVHHAARKQLQKLQEIADSLESYPILDDDRVSNLEYEEAQKYWDSFGRKELLEEMEFCDSEGNVPDSLGEDLEQALWEGATEQGFQDFSAHGASRAVDEWAKPWIEDSKACQPGHSLWVKAQEAAGQQRLVLV